MFSRLFNKALKSICRYKVAALAINKRGEILGVSCCQPRFAKVGGSIHAEMILIRRYRKAIKTIYICRVSKSGKLLNIDPCIACKKTANSLGIKIISFSTE